MTQLSRFRFRKWLNSSIWSIDGTLTGTTILSWSGPGSNAKEGVLHISQSSSITETSPSNALMIYLGYVLGGVLPLGRDAIGEFYRRCVFFILQTMRFLGFFFFSFFFFPSLEDKKWKQMIINLNTLVIKILEQWLLIYILYISSALIWYEF